MHGISQAIWRTTAELTYLIMLGNGQIISVLARRYLPIHIWSDLFLISVCTDGPLVFTIVLSADDHIGDSLNLVTLP